MSAYLTTKGQAYSSIADTVNKKVKIKEAIKLPDNDILLGLEDADEDDLDEHSPKIMDYLKLSQIELSYFEYDQESKKD